MLPVPLALSIIQILSIDLGTDLLPAIGLGQEPPEPDTLKQPPRRSDQRLLSFHLLSIAYLFLGLIQAAFSLVLFFTILRLGGWEWGQELDSMDPLYRSATGIALVSVILMQIGNVIGRRSDRGSGLDIGLLRNRLMLLGIALEIVFAWAILYYPPVQSVLGTDQVPLFLFGLAWLGIPLVFALDFARSAYSNVPPQDFRPLHRGSAGTSWALIVLPNLPSIEAIESILPTRSRLRLSRPPVRLRTSSAFNRCDVNELNYERRRCRCYLADSDAEARTSSNYTNWHSL